MAVLPIRRYPDPVLRDPAQPVEQFDDSLKRLIVDMGETMRDAPGVGLAAPQVGVQRRVLVYAPSEEDEITAVINPEILDAEGEQTDPEGCLSIPGISFEVTRALRVLVRAQNVEGEAIEIEAFDFEARILQHEIDHLNGVLFIDRIDEESRKEAMRLIREHALAVDLRESSRL